jgi:hypothetical protein
VVAKFISSSNRTSEIYFGRLLTKDRPQEIYRLCAMLLSVLYSPMVFAVVLGEFICLAIVGSTKYLLMLVEFEL